MPSLLPSFNWGSEVKNINPTLYNQLNDSYTTTARVINTKISKRVTTEDPPADSQTNLIFEIGDIWVNQSSDTAWIMTSRTTNTAVTWTLIT